MFPQFASPGENASQTPGSFRKGAFLTGKTKRSNLFSPFLIQLLFSRLPFWFTNKGHDLQIFRGVVEMIRIFEVEEGMDSCSNFPLKGGYHSNHSLPTMLVPDRCLCSDHEGFVLDGKLIASFESNHQGCETAPLRMPRPHSATVSRRTLGFRWPHPPGRPLRR